MTPKTASYSRDASVSPILDVDWETVLIATEGLDADDHARSIKEMLTHQVGVRNVQPDATTARVAITYDPSKTNPVRLHDTILGCGYKASPTIQRSRPREQVSN